jgi:hypothetical protein
MEKPRLSRGTAIRYTARNVEPLKCIMGGAS